MTDEAMAVASERLWQAVTRLQAGKEPNTPTNLIWRDETGFSGKRVNAKQLQQEYQAMQDRALLAESLFTKRDPCPRCGTRQDIGCRHTR